MFPALRETMVSVFRLFAGERILLYSNSNIPQSLLFIPFSRGTDSLNCSLFASFVSHKAMQFGWARWLFRVV
jgi:hypothetical protein